MGESLVRKSKFLSLILRHKPEAIGVELDDQGWLSIKELISKSNFTIDEILRIVQTDSKQRYTISEDNNYIRAAQGHSLNLKIKYEEMQPPDILYHGTSEINYENIRTEGLKPMKRQYVHLSSDFDTAITVGRRHGKPVVIEINAKKMASEGIKFFLSENNVWLVGKINPKYFLKSDLH